MRSEAHAQIYGELKEDIMIKDIDNGIICGLINILQFEEKSRFQGDNIKASYIPVLLKGMDIIEKYGHLLKKGEWVWLFGRFEILENVYITSENYGFNNINGLIIILHDKKRLVIYPKDTAVPDLRNKRI